MPTIVELPDSTELEFPDGMDEIAMHREISKAFPQFSNSTPSESPSIPTPGEKFSTSAKVISPVPFPEQQQRLSEAITEPRPDLDLTPDQIEQGLMTGVTIPNPVPKSWPVARGIVNVAKSIPEFMTSPAAPYISAAQAVPVLREALDAAMGAGMVKSAAQQAGEASVTGNREQMTEAIGGGLLGALMVGGPHVLPMAKRAILDQVAVRSVGAPDLRAADLAARRALDPRTATPQEPIAAVTMVRDPATGAIVPKALELSEDESQRLFLDKATAEDNAAAGVSEKPPTSKAPDLSAALENLKLASGETKPFSEYTPAIRLNDGRIITGKDHQEAMQARRDEVGPDVTLGMKDRGFLTPEGNYLTLLEVARREMEKKNKPPAAALLPESAAELEKFSSGTEAVQQTETPVGKVEPAGAPVEEPAPAPPTVSEVTPPNVREMSDADLRANAALQIGKILEAGRKGEQVSPELQSFAGALIDEINRRKIPITPHDKTGARNVTPPAVAPEAPKPPKDVVEQKQNWGIGGKEGSIYTADYSVSDVGTERTVTVRDKDGNIIGQRDPFYPQGIPVSAKARKSRISQTARSIVDDFEKSQEVAAKPAAAPEPSATGFPEAFTGIRATDDLYRKIFDAAKAGKTTVAGVKDPLLAESGQLIRSGKIDSPEALKNWVQAGKPSAAPAEPTPAELAGFRDRLRSKQDQVIAIAERLGMDKSIPISDVQIDAPSINDLKSSIFPEFESSIDAFLANHPEQAEATPAPAQAAAKVEAEVKAVARTEGQRPAKEVKNELVDRLESAAKEAPFNTEDYFDGLYVYEARILSETTRLTDRPVEGTVPLKMWLDRPMTKKDKTPNRNTAMGGKFMEEALNRKKVSKVTIDIPGDGTFTVWNTKDALQGLADRAKRISTSTTAPKQFTESKPTREQGKLWAAEAKTEPPAQGLGIVGMGAATKEEFQGANLGRATANKNDVIDAEAVARGGQPQLAPMRRTNQQVFDKAMAEIERDPEMPDRLVQEMLDNPRVLLDWEHMAVLRRRVELKYEFEKAAREAAQAFEDMEAARAKGDTDAVDARQTALTNARQQAEYWSLKLADMDRAIGRQSVEGVGGAGTEAGRALAIRRTMMNEDFSLASLEIRKRAANDYRPLTDAERADLVKQADEYKRLNTELEKKLAGAEQSEAEAKKAFAELQAKQPAKVSDYVLKTAEKWVAQWGKEAETARKNLAGKFLSPSPADLLDLAKIVRFRIGELGLDVAKITAELVKDFGEGVRPYVEGAFKTAKEMIDAVVATTPRETREKVRERVTKSGPTIEGVSDNLLKKIEKDDSASITPQVKQLAEIFYAQGIREINPMIDALQGVLDKMIPGITRQETMDALSGRGRFTLPNQDAIKKGVRDLSTQARLIAHQIDVEARRPLPRTGYQPDPMSDAARRELQRLQELKRKYGVIVTDPVKQLASALQQSKTYLRNRMADLREEIATRERIVKTKTQLQPDAELEGLRKEYEQVKAEHEAIFPKAPRTLTDEQRIAAANRALDRAIANLESDLKAGKLFQEKTVSKTPVTPELEAKRARLEALKDQRQELRDIANPKKTPAERALQSRKTRLTNQIADFQDRLARGDFSKKLKPEPLQDPQVVSLQYQMQQVRQKFNQALVEDAMRKRSLFQKIMAGGLEAINAARVLMTSFDLSAVLRQGKLMVLAHPIRASKSIMPMLRAFQSPEKAFAIEQQIMSRPNYPLYKKSGLYLAEQNQTLSAMEEAYMSRWAGKIPFVAGSQRAYTTFLNKLRADSFDAMTKTLGRRGTVTLDEAKVISHYINTSTGRGSPGLNPAAAVGLNSAFFAPRYVASRFQMLLGQPMWYGAVSGKVPFRGTGRSRAMIAAEYGRILAGMGVMYSLALASGADIETDPRSTDFGKIRFGNTRIDPMAGLLQVTVLLSRLWTGETKTAKGRIVPIRGNVPYGSPTGTDLVGRFVRTKIAPIPGAALDIVSGRDFAGQPVSLSSEALDLVTPMSLGDIYKAMQEQGLPFGFILGVLSIFGESIQTYDATKPKK